MSIPSRWLHPRRGRRSLGTRLSWQFVLLGLLPLLTAFGAAWALLVPLLVEQAESRNRELAVAVRDQVALQLDMRLHSATVLAAGLVNARTSDEARKSLAALLRADQFLLGVFSVDANGLVVASALGQTTARHPDDTVGLNLSGQPHVAQALAQHRPVWSETFLSMLSGELTAGLAVPAGDGLVVLELSVATLSSSLGDMADGRGSQVIIVDRAGRVIAHPDARLAQQQVSVQPLAPVRAALAGREGSERIVRDGVDELVYGLPVPPIGWAVIVTRPLSAVMAPLTRVGVAILGVLVLSVAGSIAIGWRMARQTGNEVALLANGAQRMLAEGSPPSLQFSTAEFADVWTRLRELFVQLGERDEQTRALQRDLQAVLDAATQVAIIATDPAGLVRVFNVGAERLLGWPASEVVGLRTPLLWLDADQVERRSAELSEHQAGAVAGFEVLVHEPRRTGHEVRDWRFVRRDGSHVEVSMAVTSMRGADASLKGFLLVAASPLTRSSYHAGDDFQKMRDARNAQLARAGGVTA